MRAAIDPVSISNEVSTLCEGDTNGGGPKHARNRASSHAWSDVQRGFTQVADSFEALAGIGESLA
jgi:hypothetical protein